MSFNPNMLYGDNADGITAFLNAVPKKFYVTSDENKRGLLHHIDHTHYSKEFQLPSLGKEYDWLNTERSLSLEDDLGKKVCVFSFFHYGCINCINILPHLKEVESKYAKNPGLAVIGIHSAKFPNEGDIHQVREALLRHNIKHPVLNDPFSTLIEKFSIVYWPTVFIVGPDRTLLFVLIGETQIAKVPFLCDLVLEYFQEISFELDQGFLPLDDYKENEKFPALLYPGNVSTDGENILISDTGHNRLILLSKCLKRKVKEIIGSGNAGFKDGSFSTASFNSPHGTVWFNGTVFVADTGNHSIRKICFESREVSTIYDGRKTIVDFGRNGHYGKFCSPWDLCLGHRLGRTETTLYVTVSGSNQIWTLDINSKRSNDCLLFAGSGKAENRPNKNRFRSGFAHPSGVTCNETCIPDELFVADSESSTIKAVSLIDGAVRNIVGCNKHPLDLFRFGDKDGTRCKAKLQHPMSVCVLDARTLIIADSYNHKIKLLDLTDCQCKTILTNEHFNEPSGICVCDDDIYIADTNNHRILTIPIRAIFSQIIPEHYDLEVFSENHHPLNDPQTTVSIANKGRLFCYFRFDCRNYVLRDDRPQKLDISFKGDKLNISYNSEEYFGPDQPSLIFERTCHQDEISGLYQPTEMILKILIPVYERESEKRCYRKVLFKILIDNTVPASDYVKLTLIVNDGP